MRLRVITCMLAGAAPMLAAACSSIRVPTAEDLLPNTPKFELKSLAPARAIRPLGAPALINPDGSCNAPVNDPEFASGGGVALDMSECDVVQRAGAPDNIAFGAGGERSLVLTYVRGERPGIYRFRSGRLVSIERGAEPEPEKRARPAKKKAPRKSAATAGRATESQ
jgi:hypothetical protein